MKKLLALVLALVMVMGLSVVSTNAAFTDADSIEYKEAVDVMSAIGVLAGTDGGKFDPKGTLTREQGAKIITYLLMGGKDAGDALTADKAPFDDVAKDRWSAGSIAYCKAQGIIAGVGGNKFAPEDTLTGYQFAKMLLVALGYDAEIEKMEGNDWSLNTARLVTKVGLSGGIKAFAGSVGVTREQAAQLGYNALTSTMVYYKSSQNVDISGANAGDVSLGTEQQVTYSVEVDSATGTLAGNSKNYSMTEQTPYTQLCEKYFPKLKLDDGASDNYGRPAEVWRVDGKKVGTFDDDAVVTYTQYMDTVAGRKQIKDDLDSYNNFDVAVSATNDGAALHVNGYTIRTGDSTSVGGTAGRTDTTAAGIAALTGNGRAVEVYVSKNAICDIVVVDTVVAQVTKVDTKSETITLHVATADGNRKTAAYTNAALSAAAVGDINAAAGAVGVKGLTTEFYITTDKGYGDFKKDDYAVITFTESSNGTIDGDVAEDLTVRSIAAPTVVTGIASTKSDSADEVGTITVDGTLYKAAYGINSGYNVPSFAVSNSKTATLLLDANGYIVGAKAGTTAISDKSVLALDQYRSLDSDGKMVTMFKGVTADGEIVRWIYDATGTTNLATLGNLGKVYTYAQNANDEYDLTASNAGFTAATTGTSQDVTGTNNTKYTVHVATTSSDIKSSTKVLNSTDMGGNNVYLDTDTNFIFFNLSNGTWKAKTVVGATDVKKGTTIDVALKYNDSDKTWHAAAVYVYNTVAPVSAATADEVVFVNGVKTGTTQVTDKSTNKAVTKDTYTAYVKGEKVENFYAAAGASTGFYTIDKNDDTGEYKLNKNTVYDSTTGSYAVTSYGVISSTKNNTLILVNGNRNYNISDAEFIDTTTSKGDDYNTATDVQEKIDTTPGSLGAYVMFDADTGKASYVYVVLAKTFAAGDATSDLYAALKSQGGATISNDYTANGDLTVPMGATLDLAGNDLDMSTFTLTVNGKIINGGTITSTTNDVTISGGSVEAVAITTGAKDVKTASGASITATNLTATKLWVGCSVTVKNLAVDAIDIAGDDPTSELIVTGTITDQDGSNNNAITVTMAGTGATLDLSAADNTTAAQTINVTAKGEDAVISTGAKAKLGNVDVSAATGTELTTEVAPSGTVTVPETAGSTTTINSDFTAKSDVTIKTGVTMIYGGDYTLGSHKLTLEKNAALIVKGTFTADNANQIGLTADGAKLHVKKATITTGFKELCTVLTAAEAIKATAPKFTYEEASTFGALGGMPGASGKSTEMGLYYILFKGYKNAAENDWFLFSTSDEGAKFIGTMPNKLDKDGDHVQAVSNTFVNWQIDLFKAATTTKDAGSEAAKTELEAAGASNKLGTIVVTFPTWEATK